MRLFTLDPLRDVTNSSADSTMQDDIFPAAEKILSDIENVVKKDPSLKSFEIVPAEDNQNKSPVFHQSECLGLASWCVQPLYCYVYRRLLELRENKHRREEPTTVARWLLGALLLNPDVTTFWNMRRELVKSRKLDATDELSISRLVLCHKPKCFDAFAYRRWLLSFILNAKEEDYDPTPENSLLCVELEVAGTCADRYANNYHAWSHRRHVMTLRESRGYAYPTLEQEWKNSLAWCQRHVSECSGFAYRQFLLTKHVFEFKDLPMEPMAKCPEIEYYEQRKEELFAYIKSNIEEAGDARKLQKLLNIMHKESEKVPLSTDQQGCLRALSYWAEECRVNETTICMYSDHESLWCHRRFLAYLLMQLIISYNKYLCYRSEPNVPQSKSRPLDFANTSTRNSSLEDDVTITHNFLMEAFRLRTHDIAEQAVKRDQSENILIERFFKFLHNIGFQIGS